MYTTYLIARHLRAGRFRSALVALFAYIRRARERRRAVIDLSQLSDHQLRDIGIQRHDIDRAVDRGRHYDFH
jgi:uncharacterized protein YjiS (DUF1127 family)